MAKLSDVVLRDIATNRPAAGTPGRLFYDTTNSKMQRDNGSTWDDVEGGGGTGSVTSVALTVPSWLSVSGSPVTTSGTLAVTAAGAQTANQVLATPDGSSGAVSLRALANGDLPTVNVAHGGTGATSFTTSKLIGSDSSSSTAALRALSLAGGLTLSGTTVTANTTYNAALGSAPGSPVSGDLWYPSDASQMARYNGASWDWHGPLNQIVQPVDSGFAWVNQGSVTLSSSDGLFYLQAPASATDAWTFRVKTAPSTPYTLTVRWRPQFASVDYPGVAIIWRNSSSGLWAGVGHYMNIDTTNTPFHVNSLKGDATPKITANYTDQAFAQWWEWVRLKDDGTNRTVYLSRDGYNWYQFHQVGRTDYVTADQIGFGIESRNATWPAFLTIDSWGTA